jgi:undecaprenyl-diphosphatase
VTYFQALVLGIVQGLTEFLPVSSSGHLILTPHVLGWPDQGLAFDAAVHLGTIGALFAYFREEIRALVVGTLSRRLILLIVVATVPAGLAGLLFESLITTHLRAPGVVAGSLAVWALVMAAADRRPAPPPSGAGDPLECVRWRQALTVGTAQALALIPGTSRSGITITFGLLSGLDRATAARFSFLLGIPVTSAAGSLKMLDLLWAGLPADEAGPLALALLAAFASGWFAVSFLVSYLRRRSLTPFVVYRLLLALTILTLVP